MNTLNRIQVKVEQPLLSPGSIAAPEYNEQERNQLRQKIKRLLKQRNAVLVAHYYVDAEIQALAEETGGTVADSLEMARFGHTHEAETLVVAGVRFMGETAKILNPEKTVIMPTLEAECSLDLSAPIDAFSAFCDEHPERTVVVYANTSAEVKARADWVVTSSNAVSIVNHLKQKGEKILWAPDKHLGSYIQQETAADMLLWDGACVVHEAFKGEALRGLREHEKDAAVLVHPESPRSVVEQADVVGSTTRLIQAVKEMPNKRFIVATDNGIFHKMKQQVPGKQLIEAPIAGAGASCESCAHCPWMALNSLLNLADSLQYLDNEIKIEASVQQAALNSVSRMLSFQA